MFYINRNEQRLKAQRTSSVLLVAIFAPFFRASRDDSAPLSPNDILFAHTPSLDEEVAELKYNLKITIIDEAGSPIELGQYDPIKQELWFKIPGQEEESYLSTEAIQAARNQHSQRFGTWKDLYEVFDPQYASEAVKPFELKNSGMVGERVFLKLTLNEFFVSQTLGKAIDREIALILNYMEQYGISRGILSTFIDQIQALVNRLDPDHRRYPRIYERVYEVTPKSWTL